MSKQKPTAFVWHAIRCENLSYLKCCKVPTILISQESGSGCTDCHTSPGIFYPLVFGDNTYAYLWGAMRTKEEYEQRRLVMAQKVWAAMKENDSQPCRECHDFSHMNHFLQEGIAVRQHLLAQQTGVTCIDCHKGLVHPLPVGAPPRQMINE